MAGALQSRGILRVVPPEGVDAMQRAQEPATDKSEEQQLTQLAGYIRTQFDVMQRHRSSVAGWNDRMLAAQRMFNGEYDPQKLAQIRQFGGSDVYARVVAVKCRAASALLREVYLGVEKPWGLDPTPEPVLPDEVTSAVAQLAQSEAESAAKLGQPTDPSQIRDRVYALMEAAQRAAKKRAAEQAKCAEDKLDDKLVEGNFYRALAEFISDLPRFPFACLKGPVVRIVPDVVWQNGQAVVENRPKMFWTRVSPFDLFFTPGVSDIEDASVIERTRLTRADLNDLLGLPGYNEEALRAVLADYGRGGLQDWMDPTDAERAVNESRENPVYNQSGLIDCLEFHGNVQGRMLLEYGFSAQDIPDELRDYFVQAWLVGRHVIKVQIAPSPRKRHPYYITSFEKVPGTPVGNALPDILSDIQEVCNAALRNLVNNMGIASGPQVVVNDDRLVPGTDGDSLFPWKRWHVSDDPMANHASQREPVSFFQPNSNASELLGIYEKFTQIADELSAIPRYVTGSERLGGAGRTASGLAMLMGNASKLLQTVASNIDRDVIQPLLQGLYDLVMLTDSSGLFRGDEAIRVRGVDVAVQRETNRQRQIEFLTATQNPVDIQLLGPKGRAKILRAVASDLGMPGEEILPSDEEIDAQLKQAAAAQALPPPGAKPEKPDSPALGVADGKAMRGMATTAQPAA